MKSLLSPGKPLALTQFFAGCDLIGGQECFYKLAFTANGHPRESLEPFSSRHFRFRIEPIGQRTKLASCDVARSDPIEQVMQQCRRKICRRTLGILACAVESAHDNLAKPGRFGCVARADHLCCQAGQLAARQVSFSVELISETNHTQLFFRIEPLNLLDNLDGCHGECYRREGRQSMSGRKL